jgi:hypothetical protein
MVWTAEDSIGMIIIELTGPTQTESSPMLNTELGDNQEHERDIERKGFSDAAQ